MRQRPTLFYLVPREFAFVVALGAAIAAFLDSSIAADSTPELKIGRVELGFKNHFKVGIWTPVRVEVVGSPSGEKQRVEVTVADSDGVPTTASTPVTAAGAGHGSSAVIYTKVGRVGSSIQVSLLNGERRVDEQTLQPDAKAKPSSTAIALPSTAELIVSFGSAPFGLRDAFPNRESEGSQSARQVVELTHVSELPTDWFGYDAVDVLVISAANVDLCRELAADAKRYDALTRWVELGGRLVVLCDGNAGKELLAAGGPLARFAPGKLAEVVRLIETETGPLERFAGVTTTIAVSPGMILRVPRLVDVVGNIEVSGGRRASDLPLVVRSAHGLGEIAFVGVELSQPSFAEWSGRGAFLQALLHPYLSTTDSGDATQRLVTRGYNDLGGALRQQLGQSFVSVVPIGFAVVTALAILYILFLGPLDYLFVNRWVRRPWVAWVTFPLIIAAFCGAATALAAWRNGGAVMRANRLELVDVDTLAGRARGTLWATIYSPAARKFDLSVRGPELRADSKQGDEVLLSWWGLPGTGIGGMQSGGIDLGIVRSGYRCGPEKNSLLGVPVLASATKSLVSRWTSPVSSMIDAELADRDGLAAGSITNRTGFRLQNVRLLYGSWAYRLGDISAGKRVDVGEQLSPRKVKTIVTHDALGETGTAKGAAEGQLFTPEKASAKEILSLMMFYEAAGGYGFAHLPNRYQANCDLSRTLELGRAILVADAARPVAQLIDDATGAAVGDKQEESTVIYRFVLPVKGRKGL
jgi:hypothetical protein